MLYSHAPLPHRSDMEFRLPAEPSRRRQAYACQLQTRPSPARSDRASAESARICLNYLTGDTMTEHSDLLTDAGPEDLFEKEMRGYSRRRVDEFVARNRSQIRDLEERLSRELDNVERLRLELSSARQASEDKPAHEEISERVGQILKLADDEAKSQRTKADDEIGALRADAKADTDKLLK